MNTFKIVLCVLIVIVLLVLLICYGCFYLAFYSPRNKSDNAEEFPIPPGEIYEPYRDKMVAWMKEVRALPHEDVSVTSFDGLTLRGRYYEYAPGAPIELMMHGYRGDAERDLCGGVQRCFALGRSALIVDQRGCGRSDGCIITFGIKERKDCHTWIDFMLEYFGPDVKIILTGISMGASTVLMAAGEELPPNVIGVLADCGYSTARDIIKKTIRDMKLPVNLAYPFVKLAAKIFGHFNLEETTPLEAMKHCKVPVIFFHGEGDDFVPCYMSKENYDAYSGVKKIYTVPGAGHGLCYLVQPDEYLETLREFFGPESSATS